MVECPQPASANATAIAIIRNRGLDREELNDIARRSIISHDHHVERGESVQALCRRARNELISSDRLGTAGWLQRRLY